MKQHSARNKIFVTEQKLLVTIYLQEQQDHILCLEDMTPYLSVLFGPSILSTGGEFGDIFEPFPCHQVLYTPLTVPCNHTPAHCNLHQKDSYLK